MSPNSRALIDSVPCRVLGAALAYFMVMLVLTWLIAPVREFNVRAGADPLLAILAQATLTLLVLTFAAGWVVDAFAVPDAWQLRLALGFGAVGCQLASDPLTEWLLSGVAPLQFAAHLMSRDNVVPALMWLFAALLPALRGRHGARA